MDWTAFKLSLWLSIWTTVILLIIGLLVSRALAWRDFTGKSLIEAVVALPLVLPPTVLGYYLLTIFGRNTWLGKTFEDLTGQTLVFSFAGLILASVIYSLPFAIQPMLRAFESIPNSLREAAWCSGLSHWSTFRHVEFPLARPGILSAAVLTFAHTMGEFGVVLMVGGNIPGETRTISIAIFDRTEAFDMHAANTMALALLVFAFVTVSMVYFLNRHQRRTVM
ncbi:MAG: molybdenum ABC transporter permease subunit [Gammaproteobacteria bacterium RBG_16_51_14]|nr:MAG: molybdenum ABC transporter permease subunit [Gammaproteobacteria bacterium RBG_16_51_14]